MTNCRSCGAPDDQGCRAWCPTLAARENVQMLAQNKRDLLAKIEKLEAKLAEASAALEMCQSEDCDGHDED